MPKMTLVFVPPGGGETDYQLEFDLPVPPRPGDYITIRQRKDETEHPGTSDFIVRRTWWHLDRAPARFEKQGGTVNGIVVECEFARGPNSSQSHRDSCEMYDERGKRHGKHPPVKDFEASCY